MRDPLLFPGLLLALGAGLWPLWTPAALPLALGVLACGLLAQAPGRGAWLAGWVSCFLLGSLAAARVGPGPDLEGQLSLAGEVIRPVAGGVDLELDTVEGRAAWGRVRLRLDAAPPPPGTRLEVLGRARPSWELVLPGAPDAAEEAENSGIATMILADRVVGMPEAPRPFQGARHEGLLQATLLGDKRGVPGEELELLRRTGTLHLLAISGLNVTLLAGLVSGAFNLLLRPLALLGRGACVRPAAALAGVGVVGALLPLAGWPVSGRRALFMAAATLLGTALGRGANPTNALGLAAGVVVLLDPAAPRDLGFQLSFGAMAGLMLVVPRVERLLPPDLPRPLRWAVEGLAATLGSTAGTLPVQCWAFQSFPLMAPASNLLAVPLASVVSLPATLVAAGGLPWARQLADLSWDLILAWLRITDGPVLHPAVGPAGAALLCLAVLARKRPSLAISFGLVAMLKEVPGAGELRLTMLAIGQGDAMLLVTPQGRRVLVDGGPPNTALLQWLRREGLTELDEVVLSHAHPDHFGGLVPVLEELEVGQVRLARTPEAGEVDYARLWAVVAERGIPVVGLEDPFFPGIRLEHPLGELPEGTEENDRSIVLLARHGAFSALLVGDAEAEAEARLDPGRVTVLKVGHHGSRSSSTADFLARVRPALALISCGIENRYGHPHAEVLARLGSRALRTDLEGTIELRSDGVGMRWRTWRAGRGWSRERVVARLLPGRALAALEE